MNWRETLLLVTVAAGCGGGPSGPGLDNADDANGPPPDAAPPDADPLPNVGAWCNHTESDGFGNNPACVEGAQCLEIRPPTDGMCVLRGCRIDVWQTDAEEENCGVLVAEGYTCIDLDTIFGFDNEVYSPPGRLEGQNEDLTDNFCVPTCTPRSDGNDCDAEFACRPNSTQWNFVDAICFNMACLDGSDCPITVTDQDTCVTDLDCDTSAGQFCVIDPTHDTDLDRGACAVPGVCNGVTGLCERHALGDPAAALGDPCLADTDCPIGGTCVAERDVKDQWGYVVGRTPPNGYCTVLGCRFGDTLPDSACPVGTACSNHFLAGGCVQNCGVGDPQGCRNNACDPGSGLTAGCDWLGDYECTDWSGWAFRNGLPIVVGNPVVCEPYPHTCSPSYPDCPTGTQCLDRETGAPSSSGLCLDATSSGPPCATHGNGALCEGSCVDRDTDPDNCGTCGRICQGTTTSCVGGTCVP